eukprot:6489184-Prymnesium_polylepis.1
MSRLGGGRIPIADGSRRAVRWVPCTPRAVPRRRLWRSWPRGWGFTGSYCRAAHCRLHRPYEPARHCRVREKHRLGKAAYMTMTMGARGNESGRRMTEARRGVRVVGVHQSTRGARRVRCCVARTALSPPDGACLCM